MPAAEKLAALAPLALFWAAGWGWGGLLPVLRRLRPAVRHAYYYLLGLGWVAGGLYALSHLLAVPLRRPAILALALLPILAGAVARWSKRPGARPLAAPAPRRRAHFVPLLALLVAGGVSLAVLAEVVTQPLTDWDGRMTWTVKARYLRQAGTVDAEALRDGRWFVSLTHYPVLLPVAQVAALELVAAGDDDPAYRTLYAAFLPVLLALVWGACRPGAGAAAAAYTVLALALLPMLTFFPGGGAISAYSDLPLACFYGGGLLLLLSPRAGLSAGWGAGILLACAVLAKDEGTALAVAALALAALTVLWRRARPARRARTRAGGLLPLLPAAGLVLAAAILLASWRAAIPFRYSAEYLTSSTLLLPEDFWTRLADLPAKVRVEMTAFKHWGLFWSMAPLVLLAGWRGLRRRSAPALALAFLAPLALVTVILLFTTSPPDLPRMTWNRFLLQGAVPFAVLFAWTLGDVLRRARWLPRVLRGANVVG